jgi:ribosomal protein S2
LRFIIGTMTNVQHKNNLQKVKKIELNKIWIFSNLLKIENDITNAQHKMYFAYLFLNCWNSFKKTKFEMAKPHFLN